MDTKTMKRLEGLATKEEINEINAALKGTVTLKRTFTMNGIRFWRVTGPANHRSLNSDLSLEGLKDWGIL